MLNIIVKSFERFNDGRVFSSINWFLNDSWMILDYDSNCFFDIVYHIIYRYLSLSPYLPLASPSAKAAAELVAQTIICIHTELYIYINIYLYIYIHIYIYIKFIYAHLSICLSISPLMMMWLCRCQATASTPGTQTSALRPWESMAPWGPHGGSTSGLSNPNAPCME